MQEPNPNQVVTTEISDSRIAAAICTLRHRMRETAPCLWFRQEGKEFGVFFFDRENPESDLTIGQVIEAWRDRDACDKLESYLLSLVPPEDRKMAVELMYSAFVQAMHKFTTQYKHHVMHELNESKRTLGLHAEQRGNQTAIFGRGVDDKTVAEMKSAANF